MADCPTCDGSGHLTPGHACSRCSGTGIDGNPQLGCLLVFVPYLVGILLLVYFLWPRS